LHKTAALEYLNTLTPDQLPDVIYYDPMFAEPANKTAKAKRGLQLIQALVGLDQDCAEVARLAQQRCRHRLVIKRGKHNPPLLAEKPTFCSLGKAMRFDVYCRPNNN
jgi:16S rRNA (guanine1516-N2)-methyltransferase